MEPETHPAAPPPISASEMGEPESPRNTVLWIITFIILAGSVIGLLLYWIWIKSPLIGWVKVLVSILAVALLAGFIYLIA